VCDACYDQVAAELAGSEVILKLLELTGEAPLEPDAEASGSQASSPKGPLPAVQELATVKSRAPVPSTAKRVSTFITGAGNLLPGARPAFTLPSVNKPHLFALKNSERELWLHAENSETRMEWVQAIRSIQKRHLLAAHLPLLTPVAGAAAAAAAASPSSPTAPPPVPQGPSWEIAYGAVLVLNKVGVGAFGEVFRARLWGTEIAMKTLRTDQFANSDVLLDELKKEVSILSQLRHPNVVLYIGACTQPPNVCILTEWCARGSLYDVLHDYSIHINAKLIIDLAIGIAQGMCYLHSLPKKIIHRDLSQSRGWVRPVGLDNFFLSLHFLFVCVCFRES
jgi:hypothetical protein